ncbi:ABC transporter [Arthrobacter alpinus]|uniref:UvrABC system protein A n=1 Tax=Arthrobacter alpinus TaxID=656366 RepID=A0A0M4RQB0_9MICC|nr:MULTISPECIES: excinuclease ABC subunit UvrA [Arthrobacter]ALE92838.1 ABC transporter [Arthrobacter alpinus]
MNSIGQDGQILAAPGIHDGFVHVRGANENNLKNVEVRIPRDAIVAFTGVSGSGKSSLAFGTIFAEAQRRFLESVAPYARRLIAQGHTPNVEFISGLPPAVALQQRRGTASSRSTVGTLTTLSNSVRMLYSRAGHYPQGATRLDSDSFSPNTVVGACPACHGLGILHTVTEDSLVPDPSLSIREGAIAAWPGAWQGKSLRDITTQLGYDVDVPFKKLPKEAREWLLFTDEQPVVEVTPERDRVAKPYKGRFWSARRSVLHTVAESKSEMMRAKALQFMHSGPCPTCAGTGFRPEALGVTVAGLNIAQFNETPLDSLAGVLRQLSVLERDGQPASDVSASISADLLERIEVLTRLGLGYLSLKRGTTTLSPGEMQRLRIATQLRSGLFGVIYVLDEPSAGLHPADAQPLLEVLEALKAAGNSVFVVEHNMDVVASADWIVDVGPRAGAGGGLVLYSGPVAGLEEVPESVTRKFLGHPSSNEGIREPREGVRWLELEGVHLHNLVGLDARFPLGVLSAVTGVSGSGKSTLVSQALAQGMAQTLHGEMPGLLAASEGTNGQETDTEVNHAVIGAVRGAEGIDRVVAMDQKPIGRTPRSNLATYTGLFDAVRKTFAETELAKERGYGAGRFSFNVAGGRCENCLGEGHLEIELLFLPGSYGPCPVCHGSRYNPETLEVTYEGKNIAEVLELSVDEAADFLAGIPAAARSLTTLREVGLGYLTLGQPAPELSGGEAQRIKLATELQRARRGHTLYLLDEPTTGLHPADVQLLLGQLNRLVDAGNTVIVVEHHMDVVAAADWVIDLGPAGGDAGGRIVATGTPAQIAVEPDSRTSHYLARRLGLEPLPAS